MVDQIKNWRTYKVGSWYEIRDRVWEVEFEGHVIRAINKISIFPPCTSEILEIDGELIEESKYLNFHSSLFASHTLNGVEREIEVRFGQKLRSIRVGCQIFIDGRQIGGDEHIAHVTPKEADKTIKKGFFRFFLTHGLPAGLIYASISLFFNQTTHSSFSRTAIAFLFLATFFSLTMSIFFWLSVKKSATRKKRDNS